MRTRNFKTLRGYLDYLSRNHGQPNVKVYEQLNDFFSQEFCVMYIIVETAPENGRYKTVYESVSVPWEEKYPVAQKIVDFHWPSRTKGERWRIAERIAKGEGDLSLLQTFIVEMMKKNGAWEYVYCTSGLSGPSYNWCKRRYLRSIFL